MEEKKDKGKRSIINIGTSLMIVVLMGLSFAVIAALAISSSKNNYDLSQKMARHTTEYYEACNTANWIIHEGAFADMDFNIAINDDQQLHVKVENQSITAWEVVNNTGWEGQNDIVILD